MAAVNIGRIFALNILLAIICEDNAADYGVPPVMIQAFKPKGFRASLKYHPDIRVFVFHGNVNEPIQVGDAGTLSGEAHRVTYKSAIWKIMVEDLEVQLKVGDVINYYAYVLYETAGFTNYNLNFFKSNLSYTITELEELTWSAETTPKSSSCKESLTKTLGARVICKGDTIFEDYFDSLSEKEWRIEQYIPFRDNELPFVSYQRLPSNPTVSVVNGNLRIAPILQQNVPGYNEESITSGSLNLLNGCTSAAETCYKVAEGADILPPIVSGRIATKIFAFKYGTIHVRAKLPLGDWLYPEILLEPYQSGRFGRTRYASGVLKVASARGNSDLNASSLIYGSRILYGGPVMDATCSTNLLNFKLLPEGERWGDEFHVYTLRWDPDRIILSVDGVEWHRMEPPASGLVDTFPENCTHVRRQVLGYHHVTKMAPFNDFFYITLGVAAGGITEFPDGLSTGNKRQKPWTNDGRKAMVTFWQDMNNWITTWDQPELLVDYVRVVAL